MHTQTLKELGMEAVIVIAADNGGTYEHLPSVVEGSSNYPLRGGFARVWIWVVAACPHLSATPSHPQGHKYSYFEGGVRSTALVNYPGLNQSMIGKRLMVPIHMSDWYPTFCHLAGVNPDDGYKPAPIDGVNVWPILNGQLTVRGRGRTMSIHRPLLALINSIHISGTQRLQLAQQGRPGTERADFGHWRWPGRRAIQRHAEADCRHAELGDRRLERAVLRHDAHTACAGAKGLQPDLPL